MPGIVFDIQSYAIYDGPGIRTCVYLKGCPLRCYWCHNPESQAAGPERGWWADKCTNCGTCVEACPHRALSMVDMGKDKRLHHNPDLCKSCGKCADICPTGATEMIGREYDISEVMEKILPDKPFFEASGGGVTISGGEPTFRRDFLFELLDALRAENIHVVIETCGYFAPGIVDDLAGKADLFLYDIKHIDPEAHKAGTGVDNRSILDNFKALLAKVGASRIIPRLPLIPGFNTDDGTIAGIIGFLKESGYDGPVHLMPYHNWARGKYDRLGRTMAKDDPGTMSREEMERISSMFREHGFEPAPHGG